MGVADGQEKEKIQTYGKSTNHIYVTGAAASLAFESVLDLGCRGADGLRPGNPGEAAADAAAREIEVVDGIWNEFKSNIVRRVDGTPLVYNHDPDTTISAATMLAAGKGQCTAWTDLLVLTLGAQGVTATSTRIDPPGDRFAVKAMPAQGSGASNYEKGTLAEGGFGFHQVVRITAYPDRIYDPSYGGLTEKTDGRSVELKYEDENITHFRFPPGNWVANVAGDALQLTFTP